MDWRTLHDNLDSWAALPKDWDGEGGEPPSAATIESGKVFLAVAEATGLPVPDPFIEGDGEIGWRWKDGAARSSVSILADGSIVGYGRAPDSGMEKLDAPVSPPAIGRAASIVKATLALA